MSPVTPICKIIQSGVTGVEQKCENVESLPVPPNLVENPVLLTNSEQHGGGGEECAESTKNFADVRLEQINRIQRYQDYLENTNNQQYRDLIIRKVNALSPEQTNIEVFKHITVNMCICFAWFLLLLYLVNIPTSFFAFLLLVLTTIFVNSSKISRFFEVLQKFIDVFCELWKNTTDFNETIFDLVCKKFGYQSNDHLENEDFRFKPGTERKYFNPSDAGGIFTYNFKIRVSINSQKPVYAEIDSDSHLSLISESYFKILKKRSKIVYLKEKPPTFKSLTGNVQSEYPPLRLNVQIGNVQMQGRFIVSPHLKSSEILLGSDFSVPNKISISAQSDNRWTLSIGPLDSPEGPIGEVPVLITSKMSLNLNENENFSSLQCKKVSLAMDRKLDVSLFQASDGIKNSPFTIEGPLNPDGTVLLKNNSILPSILPANFEIGHILENKKSENKIYDDLTESDPDMDPDLSLEPGYRVGEPNVINMEEELDFVKKCKEIPENLKEKLISFLREHPSVFSGEEFSKNTFPTEIFTHHIELNNDLPELNARPYPAAGIRLDQLKQAIHEQIANGVLIEKDSPTVSPCFFVTKKPTGSSTACKGRLVFDYRKLNKYVKPLHFPLTNQKTFFDQASKFKLFISIDICNAFLSIKLNDEAMALCAIVTPFGTFQPTRSPFGLKTSPSAFCNALWKIIHDLPFVVMYMDDLLIGADTPEELMERFLVVLKRLADHNLKIRISKTKFFLKELKILGTIFSSVGKKIDPEKVEAIRSFPPITTLKGMQSFLGLLAYISSFIPNYSTAAYPLFATLKNQNKQFQMTEEAVECVQRLKDYICQETMLYNIDFSAPLYIITDASQVACGSLLYQIVKYEKNKKGMQKLCEDLGFEPDLTNNEKIIDMLPGVSVGANTPVVTDFCMNDKEIYDKHNTLHSDETYTAKKKRLSDKYVFLVKPCCWYSKTFTLNQIRSFSSMEKEFFGILLALQNFREYIESAVLTYLLSDSQSILWALKHRESNLKVTRWCLKLFEYRFNLVMSHISGKKNVISDFLSRIYYVNTNEYLNQSDFKHKDAQHIYPLFHPCEVLTKEKILKSFFSNQNCVEKCSGPVNCHLNVNRKSLRDLYEEVGPFTENFTCVQSDPVNAEPVKVELLNTDPDPKQSINKKVSYGTNYGFAPDSLNRQLTIESFYEKQRVDENLSNKIEKLEKGETVGTYMLQKSLLYKKFVKETDKLRLVVPTVLIPIVLANFHFQCHSGAKKLASLIKLTYYWKNMEEDCKKFCAGCVLCSIHKSDLTGKTQLGEMRLPLYPGSAWQIDVVSGLPTVLQFKSFLNMVDLYTGFSIAVPLKYETSKEISKIFEGNIVKIFGPPQTVSSDNASNLQGIEMRKLLNFLILNRGSQQPTVLSHMVP